MDRVSRFKIRGSRLVDAKPGLLGLIAESGSNWLEEWGLGLAGARGSDIGRVMDGGRRRSLVLVGCAARFKSSPRTQHFQHIQAPLSLRMAVFLMEPDPNGLAKPHLID